MSLAPLILIGYGYSAATLHRSAKGLVDTVHATTRSVQKMQALKAQGIEALLLDTNAPDPVMLELPKGGAWLISVPPNDEGCPIYSRLAPQATNAAWIGYLSTTGVYGDLGGDWAFEHRPAAPQSRQGRNRLQAEQEWQPLGAHIFRLPGIYGPGRSALERVQAGTAKRIIKPGHVFSRIHVQDLAQALLASMSRPDPGRVYNIADDCPAPSADVIAFAAQLCGVAPPPAMTFEQAGLNEAAARFYQENRRVSNARAKAELDWTPDYPDFRAGLVAIMESANSSTASSIRAKSSGRDKP